jgi:hypothetical protein
VWFFGVKKSRRWLVIDFFFATCYKPLMPMASDDNAMKQFNAKGAD